MSSPYRIIRRPILSEKADLARDKGTYYFEVEMKATKPEIRAAVEKVFNKKVLNVHTLIVRGKGRRVGQILGRKPSWKKAAVTLKEGESIDLFEGV